MATPVSDVYDFKGMRPLQHNVECFLDYMELWVPRRQIEGLLLWLSQTMRFPVSLSSLERSNHLLSRCRYCLNSDPEGNFIFRVWYSGCKVQAENGFHALEIHMVKKTATGNGQSDRYSMRCPALTVALGRETVRCEPHFVQVSRPVPLRDSSDQEQWFLVFRGEFVVSVEDASLIGIEVEISDFSVTVRGQRGQLLNAVEFMDRQTDMLPLWVARGFYAYSLEASCPFVTRHPGEEVTLSIPKQRVGLVKRGTYTTETLTLRNIVVGHFVSATVTENKYFVVINIPSNEVLQSQECHMSVGNVPGVQVYYSIDLVLEFVEMAYPMNWTMENYYECTVASSQYAQREMMQQAAFSTAINNIDVSCNTSDNEQVAGPQHMTSSPSLPPKSGYMIDNTTADVNDEMGNLQKLSIKEQFAAPESNETLEEVSGSGYHSDIEENAYPSLVKVSSINSTVLTPIEDNPTSETYSIVTSTGIKHKALSLTTGQPKTFNVYRSESPQPKEKHVTRSGAKVRLSRSDVTNVMTQNMRNYPTDQVMSSSPLKIPIQPNVTSNQSSRDNQTMAFPPTTNLSNKSYLDSRNADPVLMSVSSHWPEDNMVALDTFPRDAESNLLVAMSADGYIPLGPTNVSPSRKREEWSQRFNENRVKQEQEETLESGKQRIKSAMDENRRVSDTFHSLLQLKIPGSPSKQSGSQSSGQIYLNSKTNMGPGLWTMRSHLSRSPLDEILDSPSDEFETIAASEDLVLSHT
uniref:Chromosome 1 open reading frame 127 n=1 Tax=Leptobrachium leishanense TaxID=445787 RepID=A0A8C5PVE6_9ANUR